jgi:cyanophycin synthetase
MTTAMTDRISALAETITTNKDLTKRLLAEAGLPVPEGRVVASAEQAWQVARAIGVPVVVKPLDSDYGNGVSLNVHGREAIAAAYANARQWRKQVIVERFQQGDEYRLLVIGGEVVSALRRDPAYVIGDGRSTVRQLIEYENRQHREHPSATLFPLPWDEESIATIADQGLTPESAPAAGRKVLLRRKYRSFSGGRNIDVTCQMAPALREMAVAAAQQMHLEIAGVDVVACEAPRPAEGQPGVIVEINAGPALFEHMPPYVHHDRGIGDKIVDLLFPPGETGRIPLAALLGRNAASIAGAIAAAWELGGLRTALATQDVWQVGSGLRKEVDGRGRERVQALLTNVFSEAAVVEIDPHDVLENGFGFDRCSLLVCLPAGNSLKVKEYRRLALRLGELLLPEGRAIIVEPHPCREELSEHFGDRALLAQEDDELSQFVAATAQAALCQDVPPKAAPGREAVPGRPTTLHRRFRQPRELAISR